MYSDSDDEEGGIIHPAQILAARVETEAILGSDLGIWTKLQLD